MWPAPLLPTWQIQSHRGRCQCPLAAAWAIKILATMTSRLKFNLTRKFRPGPRPGLDSEMVLSGILSVMLPPVAGAFPTSNQPGSKLRLGVAFMNLNPTLVTVQVAARGAAQTPLFEFL